MTMPVPSNTSNPQDKIGRDARIKEVAEHGADLRPELRMNKPSPSPKPNIK